MHPRKRKLLIALFAAGTVLGFGSGFHSLHYACRHHAAHRSAFERHVAAVCIDAAKRGEPPANAE